MAVSRHLTINLPISSLSASESFYTALGFSKNDAFSSATAAFLNVTPHLSLMLHTPDGCQGFMPKDRQISNAKAALQMLPCLEGKSREEVDELVDKAVKAGGKADPTGKQEMGGYYGRSFEDPDGHVWILGFAEGSAEKKD